MIKILFFIEKLEGGGAQVVLHDLVNSMDKTRFDITVQTVWPCEAEKYLADGVHYKSVYPDTGKLNHTRYRAEAALGLTYALHIKGDYDIECAYLECGATKIMAASTNKKAKKLAWVHCDLKKAMGDPVGFAESTRKYYEKFDKVICVSKNVEESFRELFGDGIPTEVVYNTIDDGKIREKALLPLPDGMEHRKLTVMTAGTMYPPKNFMRLLKTHKRLIQSGIDHDLWILGDGCDRQKLEAYVENEGLGDTVFMPGFQSNPYPYIKAADVVVCSSNYEGFSTFITEAIILGKPVVTTRCSGMDEILGDSEFGVITENDDDAFYEGLRIMLVDATARENYSMKANERGKLFSKEALTLSTERILKALIEEKYEN